MKILKKKLKILNQKNQKKTLLKNNKKNKKHKNQIKEKEVDLKI